MTKRKIDEGTLVSLIFDALSNNDNTQINSILENILALAEESYKAGKPLIDLNIKNPDGDTLLLACTWHSKCILGVQEFINKLLDIANSSYEAGKPLMDLNIQNFRGDTLLSLAVELFNFQMIKKLLNFANISNQNDQPLIYLCLDVYKDTGNKILSLACTHGRWDIINILLSLAEKYHINNYNPWLNLNAEINDDIDNITTLVFHHKKWFTLDKLLSIAEESYKAGKPLVNLNIRDHEGNTLILHVINNIPKSPFSPFSSEDNDSIFQYDRVVNQLLALAKKCNSQDQPLVDLNISNVQNDTPLFLALKYNNFNLINKLLALAEESYKAGKLLVDLNIRDREGNTPLLFILKKIQSVSKFWQFWYQSYADKLLALAEKYNSQEQPLVDLNIKDSNDNTPLFLALKYNDFNLINKLLALAEESYKAGKPLVDLNITDDQNDTPLLFILKKIQSVSQFGQFWYQSYADKLLALAEKYNSQEQPLVDLNIKDSNDNTPLFLALKYNDFNLINKLLALAEESYKAGKPLVDLNITDDQNDTPLLFILKKIQSVSQFGQFWYQSYADKLLALAEKYNSQEQPLVDLNIKDSNDNTPLFLALKYNDFNLINKLLALAEESYKAGKPLVDLNITDDQNDTPLLFILKKIQSVSQFGQFWYQSYVDKLLALAEESYKAGKPLVDLNITDDQNDTPLLFILKKIQSVSKFWQFWYQSYVDKLLAFAEKYNSQEQPLVDLNITDSNDNTPLFLALKYNDFNLINKLLALAEKYNSQEQPLVDLNITDDQNDTPLLFILKQINNLLYSTGSDYNGDYIIKYNQIVKKLLALAKKCNSQEQPLVDLNIKDSNDNTPLFLALKYNNFNLINKLLALAKKCNSQEQPLVDLNIKDSNDNTPLFWALKYNDFNLINKLLALAEESYKAGKPLVDLNITDDQNDTPLLYALQQYNEIDNCRINTIINKLLDLAEESYKAGKPLVDLTIENKKNFSALLWRLKYNNTISNKISELFNIYINVTNDDVDQAGINKYTLKNIGATTFNEISENGYFIDKTLFIKDFLTSSDQITLITCPRRWGKSVNMSMLHQFLTIHVDNYGRTKEYDIRRSDNYKVFSGPNYLNSSKKMNILNHQDIIDKYMGKHPVIYLDFRNIKCETYERQIESCIFLLKQAFRVHEYLLYSHELTENQKEDFQKYSSVKFDKDNIDQYLSLIDSGLCILAGLLVKHFKVKVFVLIDEYDTPTNELSLEMIKLADIKAHIAEIVCKRLEDITREDVNTNILDSILQIKQVRLEKASKLIASFMESILKPKIGGESYLEKALITGIFRIAKAGFFSGLNNVTEYNFLNNKFFKFYGFTKEDIKSLHNCLHDSTLEKIMKWYGGYIIHKEHFCNPWSIVQFISHNCEFGVYGDISSNFALIENVLKHKEIKAKLLQLVGGTPILYNIAKDLTFDLLHFIKLSACINNDKYSINIPPQYIDIIFPFLIATGYISKKSNDQIVLSNQSSRNLFCEKILHIYADEEKINFTISGKVQEALLLFFQKNNNRQLEQELDQFLLDIHHALYNESLIQGIFTCMSLSLLMSDDISWCASNPRYTTTENKIPDIVIAKDKKALIIELKYNKQAYNEHNTKLLDQAYAQALKYDDFFSKDYIINNRKCMLVYVFQDKTIVKSSNFQLDTTIQGTNSLYTGLSVDSVNYNIQMMNGTNLILVDINSINSINSNLALLKVENQNNNHAIIFLKKNNFISIIDPLSKKSEFSNILEEIAVTLLNDKKIQEVNVIYSGLQQPDTAVCADISLILSKYIEDKFKDIELIQDIITIIQSLAREMYSGQISQDNQNILVVKYCFSKLERKQDIGIIFEVKKNNKDLSLLDNYKIISLQKEEEQQDNHDMLVHSELIGEPSSLIDAVIMG